MILVESSDGVTLACEREGEGPPVVLVVGAFNGRETGAPLAAALAARFTVWRYDRRGRGASGDRAPYAVDREIDDLAAVIRAAGGSAAVVGFSSGAILALRAAAAGVSIDRLVLYDLPLRCEGPAGPDHATALAAQIAAGRRADAVEYFQAAVVGLPLAQVEAMRDAPFRPALEALAPTLVYDATLLADGRITAEQVRGVRVPTLVAAGERATPFMAHTAPVLAGWLLHGRARVVPGATHDLNAALAPVVEAFLDPGT